MDATTLFLWVPKIFFALLFVVLGIWAFRHRVIKTVYVFWIIILYFVERIVEIALRTYLTAESLTKYDPSSFEYIKIEAIIGPSLRAVIIKQLVIIAIAFCVWACLALYAKRTHYQKIDSADVLLFSFGTLISGWPNFLIYIGLVFLFALCGLAITQGIHKNRDRMIVTPYFAAAGIVILFWGWELSRFIGLYALR